VAISRSLLSAGATTTTPPMTTRREVLRLGGVAGAGVIAAACSVAPHGHANRSVTTTSDASGSIELPSLFDADPQAQQAAHRLLAIAPSAEELRIHEQFMQLAVDVSGGNASYPFGAVIVDHMTGEVLGRGVNGSSQSPMLHGEAVAINDYIARHGNQGWNRSTLYSTGEPCAMCCGALAWAGVPRVVWGSSIGAIRKSDIAQIDICAVEVAARAYEMYTPELYLGGVLADVTDKRFATRRR
jgi:tRNA(Arg) A34 adenosine deaminase TadA